jgi:peroxiredoxin
LTSAGNLLNLKPLQNWWPEMMNFMAGTQPKTRFNKGMEIFLWLVGLGVLAENVSLFQQNRHLSEASAPQITAGTQVEMLAGIAFDGRLEPVALPAAGSKLLVITFSRGCPACQANQEGWMRLASALKQKAVSVLWVSRDPVEITRDYCVKHGIPLSDTLADPPFRTFAQLGLARVPNTFLVGGAGRVEKVWAGRLDQAGWKTLFAYFGEPQETALPQSQVGANATGCGSELSQTSVKSCK